MIGTDELACVYSALILQDDEIAVTEGACSLFWAKAILQLALIVKYSLQSNKMIGTDELACVYSALILQDDEIAVTPEKITTLLKAANVDVESYWPGLFARALEGIDVKQLITNVGAGVGSAPAAGAAPAAAAADSAAKEEKKEEKKEESDMSDDDMGFGLFD